MRARKKNAKAKPHSLESVAWRELGIELDKEHQNADWGGELTPAMLEYAALDSQVLLPLAEVFESRLAEAGLGRVRDIEQRALRAVLWMANAGVPFDVSGWERYLTKLDKERNRLEEQLAALAPDRPGNEPWNWNSPQQVKEAFALAGVKLPDTGRKTLSRCEHPLTDLLLEQRKISKMVSHFGPKLLEFAGNEGRIYASWLRSGRRQAGCRAASPIFSKSPTKLSVTTCALRRVEY